MDEDDMLWEVAGQRYESPKEAHEAFRNASLPFEITLFRRRDIMGVLDIRQAGSGETHGHYTIHGYKNDQFRFTKNDDPQFEIFFEPFGDEGSENESESYSDKEEDSDEEPALNGQWVLCCNDVR